MITLRKRNGERFLVNHNQIECIELIPECKIVMMNHDYYLVKDTVEVCPVTTVTVWTVSVSAIQPWMPAISRTS